MDWSLISIFISFILGVLAIRYLQRFDIYDREPYWSMLVAVLIGGFSSVFIGLALYEVIMPFLPAAFTYTFTGALLVIGPVEELAKLLGLVVCWPIIRKQISEVNDSIIYMACVALGFSLIENYMYATRIEGSEYLLFLRLFISTPMHITFSVFMGYALYRIVYNGKSLKTLGIAFLWAVILHGAFDGFLFNGQPLLVAILAFISIQQVLALANFSNYLSPYKLRFNNIAENYRLDQATEKHCPYCRGTTLNDVISFKSIILFHCHTCKHYHGTQENITRLLNYLHPRFRIGKKPRELEKTYYGNKEVYTFENTIHFSSSGLTQGFFGLADITALTAKMKNRAKQKLRNNPYSPARYFVEK
ncbi:MAG: PrsW family intramembrane metalloprotease [Bacteroidales bacterium]